MDVIVIGLGGMGSAAASALARRGHRVLGFEQFAAGHDQGSSHGSTRIIRTAYYEHPDYVPLVRRAFHEWAELERRTSTQLLTRSPVLSIGKPDGELINGVRQAAFEHQLNIEHPPLSAFPQFQFSAEYRAVLEHDAGILFVDRCVRAPHDDAVGHGAKLCFNSAVESWHSGPDGVTVHGDQGTVHADRLIITAGPWAAGLLADAGIPLTVMRQVVFWLPPTEEFQIGRFPTFIADTPEGAFYALPGIDSDGLKIARHYGEPKLAHPSQIRRAVDASDERPVRQFIRRRLPSADRPFARSSTCIYTLTPDRHFVIDRHPRYASVVMACGFSGHGFKFAPVVGEILADLAVKRATAQPIRRFRADRFAS